MIRVVQDAATGHFHVVARDAETVAICATREAADDVSDLLVEAWEEAVAAAVARARMKHGAAVIDPR